MASAEVTLKAQIEALTSRQDLSRAAAEEAMRALLEPPVTSRP